MKKTNVISQTILAVGYQNNQMEIKFKNGAVFRYKKVPEDVYRGLLGAESKSEYFNTNIKNKFVVNRMT